MKSREQLIREWTKGRAEIDLLENLATQERKIIAENLEISVDALNKRIETIRRHAVLYPWYSAEIKRLKKQFAYLAGVLAPQKPSIDDLEEME